MRTRLPFFVLPLLCVLSLCALGRRADAQEPRYDRLARDLRCENTAAGDSVIVGTVGFKSVKPGLTISLETKAVLRQNGVAVESVLLDVEAQPPGGASDCGGACVVPDEACVSYVSGGVKDCGAISFDLTFATVPNPGDVFELELMSVIGSVPEIDITNDVVTKVIPPASAVGQDRAIDSLRFEPRPDGGFDVFVNIKAIGPPPEEFGVSLILILYHNGQEVSKRRVPMDARGEIDCVNIYYPECDCYVLECIYIEGPDDLVAAPGDQVRAVIRPAEGSAPDPNERNNSLTAWAPRAAPQWNRRASVIEYFPSPTNPAACRVVAHVAASADDLIGEIDLGTAADLYVNGIREDVDYANFVGTPGFMPNDCAENCDLTGDDCVSLPDDGFAECGFLIKRLEFSHDVFAGDSVRVLVRRRDGLAVVETDTADDVLVQIVPPKPDAAADEEAKQERGRSVEFRRGDVVPDGIVTITDPIAFLEVLFLGVGTLPCQDAADTDDSGDLALNDVIVALSALFAGQGPLAAPGMDDCGVDPTSDNLSCLSYDACDN